MQQESHKRRKKQASGLTLKQEEKMETVLTKALGVNVKFKKPSEMLEAALNALSLDFGKLQTKVDKVFEIGRKERYDDMDIGVMVRERMKEDYSERTIQRVLPETAKMSKHDGSTSRYYKREPDKMSGSERETSKQEQDISYKLAKSIDDITPAQIKQTAEYYFERYKENQSEIDRRGREIVQLKRRITELEKKVTELEQKLKAKESSK